MATASVTQVNVRIYADDNADVDSCTALAAQNATLTRQTGTANRFIARVLVQNDNSALWNSSTQWEYRRNSGTWTTLNASSSFIRTTGGLPDEATAIDTSLITGGTGTFETDGVYNESTGTISPHLAKNNHGEFAICCYLVAGDVAHNDTIELRLSGAGVTAWNNYPTLTVDAAQAITLDGAVTVNSTIAATMQYTPQAQITGAVTVTATVAAGKAEVTPDLWNERFEAAPGYDETWSAGETITGASTIDEDYTISSTLPAPPLGFAWGSDCLELYHAAGSNAYVLHQFGASYPETYTRVEFRVTEKPAANQISTLAWMNGPNDSYNLWQVDLWTAGSQLRLLFSVWDDTTQNSHYVNIDADKYYRFEAAWNSTADTWEWKVNGVSQTSGSLTGGAETRVAQKFYLGSGSTTGGARVYIDNVGVDVTEWIGPSDASGLRYTQSNAYSITGAVTVNSTIAATMQYTQFVLFDDGFEGTGYEETWSQGETVTNGTLDEDYATSSVTGAPADWESQCLQVVNVLTEDSLVEHRFVADPTVTTTAFSVIVGAESFSNSQFNFIFATEDNAGNPLGRFAIGRNAGGSLVIFARVYATGSAVDYDYSVSPISLDTEYRFEFYWNTVADEWEWRVNGSTEGSGALSGAAVDWEMDRLIAGIPANADAASTMYLDNVKVYGAEVWTYVLAGDVTVNSTVAATMEYTAATGATIVGAVTVGVDPTATVLDYTRNAALTGAVTVGVDPTATDLSYNRNAALTGAVTVDSTVAATLSYNRNAELAGAVTVGVDPTATELSYNRNASIAGDVTVGVDPTATDLSYNRNASISGDVTVGSTISAALQYARHFALAASVLLTLTPSATMLEGRTIDGDVTVTPSVAATMDYNRNASIDGDVTVGVSVASAMDHTGENAIIGDITVGVDPTASALDYTLNAAIAGDVTVGVSVAGDMLEGRGIAGTVTVIPSISATLDYTRNAALSGDITVTPSIAATMQYAGENLIDGAVTVTVTPAAVMLEGRVLGGDVTVTPSIAAALDYTQNLSITGAVTVEVIPSYGVAPPAILDNAIAWWHADTYDPDTDGQSWPDQSGNAHHAQLGSSTGADTNDPLFLPYDGTQYVYLPNTTTGTGIKATSHPSRADGGDLEVVLDVALDDWASNGYLFSKYHATSGGNMSYALRVNADASLTFYWSESGTTLRAQGTTPATLPVSNGDRIQIKVTLDVDNGSGGYDVKFWSRATSGDSWAQLGDTKTGGATTNVTDSAAEFSLAEKNGSLEVSSGKWYRLTLKNGIDGTAFLDLDFTDNAMIDVGDTSFTENSANGDTFTVYTGFWTEPTVIDRNLWLLTTDDYFEVADHDDLDFNDEDQTWYHVFRKRTDVNAFEAWLSKSISLSSDFGYYAYIATNETYNARICTAGIINTDISAAVGNSQEHGWGAVIDQVGNTIEAFVDGTGTGSPGSVNITDVSNSDPLRFGATAASTPASYVKGYLVSVALFRSALSDADMATLDTALKGSIGAAYNAFEYNQNPSIAGDVTVTATVAATMLEGRVLAGDVTVTPTVASTMSYTSGNEIVGDITVVATPAATLDYTLNAALTGDITVGIAVSSGMLEGRGIIGAVTVTPTIASALDYTLNASIAGDITVGVDPTASALLYNINKSIDGDVTVTPSVSGIMLEGRVLDGAVTVAATPASTMSYSSGHTIAGDVTVGIAVASTMLEGRVIDGAVTVTVDPTASALLYSRNYLITGDTTVGITVASGMTYESGKEIVGAVTVDITPTASLAYNTHQLISGDTTVTIAIDGSPTYAAADEIVGSITVTITPASTLDYTRNADITGDVTVGISVNGEMLEGRVLDGAVTVVPTISSGMEYSSHSTIAGDVTVNISIASGMAYTSEGSINGDVTVTITVASGLDYTFTRSIAGDITVTPTVSAEMLEGRSLGGAITVTPTISAVLAYNRNASISGDITVTPTIASAMDATNAYDITGDISVDVTVSSPTTYTFIRSIDGDVTVQITVAATMSQSYGDVVYSTSSTSAATSSTSTVSSVASTAVWLVRDL